MGRVGRIRTQAATGAHLRFGGVARARLYFGRLFFLAFLGMAHVFQSRRSVALAPGACLAPYRRAVPALGVAAYLALTACGVFEPAPPPPPQQAQGLFGPEGIVLFTNQERAQRGGGEIGVNAFLWRATLDTISFMPLASADPFGGVVITDWYTPATAQTNERFKLNVLIKDQRLRSDGVKVTVFRQERAGVEWRDVATNTATGVELENAILTRARQMWLDANAAP